uniref:uncharacterized protein LOC122587742 n=1 Tax=Erigeron canadensis TaxID=72917 RepID=UPI001CB8BCB8|nr:uncharacterized protein LOC122587742 [Erigeron canadensis]
MRVQDSTGSSSFVMWDRDVQKLLGLSANDIRQRQLNNNDDESYPHELEGLLNVKVACKIKIDKYNLKHKGSAYIVIKMCDDPDIITELEEPAEPENNSEVQGEPSMPQVAIVKLGEESQGAPDSKDAFSVTGDSLATEIEKDSETSPLQKRANETPGVELTNKITKLIIWDEAPMIHKHCFEALDRTMRDILRSTQPNSEDQVFGGKVVVFGGDFRQILPVIPKGTRSMIVNASLNSSYIWHHYQVLKLTVNMRLKVGTQKTDLQEVQEFAEWILKVGDGVLGADNDGEAEIEIPKDLLITDSNDPLQSLINFTYPNMLNSLQDPMFFQQRTILAPTHDVVGTINEKLLDLM